MFNDTDHEDDYKIRIDINHPVQQAWTETKGISPPRCSFFYGQKLSVPIDLLVVGDWIYYIEHRI